MKISPITVKTITLNKTNYQTKANKQNNSSTGDTFVSFKGKQYPSGYYTDQQIAYAKKFLGKKDWETKYFICRNSEISRPKTEAIEELAHDDSWKTGLFALGFILTLPISAPAVCGIGYTEEKKVKKQIEDEISKLRPLMVDLNNEKIRELQEKEKQAKIKQKQLEAELKKKEAERNERLRKEQLNAKIKDKLTVNFLNPIKYNSEQTPTAIMIEGTEQSRRKEIFNWLKDEVEARTVSFTLPQDEDDALYRLNTELQYAQENYEKNGKRTVLFIEDFSHVLKSSEVTNETIADMKAFLFSLSEDKEPLTIVFETPNSSNIDSAFLKNKRRIPLKINIDDLTLGQKKDWKLHLDQFIADMSQQRLEIHKCWYTERVEEALKEENYREVVRLKETLAMICEMQGKERDAYLLRCDIENYLKKI